MYSIILIMVMKISRITISMIHSTRYMKYPIFLSNLIMNCIILLFICKIRLSNLVYLDVYTNVENYNKPNLIVMKEE